MADKASNKTADADDDTAEKKSGKGKIKIIVLVLCIALAGAAYVLGTRSAAPASGADTGPTTTTTIPLIGGCHTKPDVGAPAHVINLSETSINLVDGHYLRVAVSLGLCADVVLAAPADFMGAPAQDIVVSTLSGSTMVDLATSGGRDTAKKALTEQISAAYPGVVYEVFFVEFVMQ